MVNTVDVGTVYAGDWFEFDLVDNDADKPYMLNPFNGFSVKRVPYFTVQVVSDVADDNNVKNAMFNRNTPIYMDGGEDGDLSNEEYERLVSAEMDKYVDTGSDVMDLAVNVESIFYDSGFSLDIKKKLVNFISVRKDTFVVLSTRVAGETKPMTLTDERAIAINLKSTLALAPESTFFGTPVARGMIVAGSGIHTEDNTNTRWPLTLHIAIKASKMMGAENGKWNPNYTFDMGMENEIENFVEIEPAFVPQDVKSALWSSGLVWPERYNMAKYYFPALQTVYENDTSVLNNFFTAMAITTITKVAAEAHRAFTGTTKFTPDQLIEEVENFMTERLKDRFAGLIKTVVKVMITKFDRESGYSWTTAVKIGANTARTVNTFYIEADRLENF
jgi:hypothetical protein